MPFGLSEPTTIRGRILRVDLSTRSWSVEEPEEQFYRTYLGGSGFTAYYLLREAARQTDPLGPGNPLIFSNGPLTGLSVPGAGRHGVGAKSPLTGGFGDAQAGGYWGYELKRAGFDAIVITGASERPVYLWVHDGQVEFRDAEHLWGALGGPCLAQIHRELGDDRARVSYIGPAGENMVRYACIGHDLRAFAGRTGLGAVMGSKKLKAIAVRGSSPIQPQNPERVKELTRKIAQQRISTGFAKSLNQYGTACLLPGLSNSGGCPTRNFRLGHFDGVEAIGGPAMDAAIVGGKEGCYACPIKCKRVSKPEGPYPVGNEYGGPEYETLGSLGSCCGIDDIYIINKANQMCTDYGLDTISTGVTIAFAMECFEQGLLTLEDTGGLALEFGNGAALLELIPKIAARDGIGGLLAEGSMRAAAIIGRGAEEYAVHVHGQELAMHEPRLKHGLGLGYAISPTGADHCHNIHDTKYGAPSSIASLRPFGILKPPQLWDIGPEKVRLTALVANWEHVLNSSVMCRFVPWDPAEISELFACSTGWDTSLYELAKAGERVATMARVFNLREGLDPNDDMLPKRVMEPFASGPLQGMPLAEEDVKRAVRYYYEAMGWSADGSPTEYKLYDLNVSWLVPMLG